MLRLRSRINSINNNKIWNIIDTNVDIGICANFSSAMSSSDKKLVFVEFEVSGKVQGVFFRKYTVKQGKELGLTGWCRNTNQGTVVGQLEGEAAKIEQMKKWLQTKGSPSSKIEKTEFRNEKEIDSCSFSDFKVRG